MAETAFEVVPPVRLAFWDLISRTFLTLKDRPLFFFSFAAMAVLPANWLKWWGYEIADIIMSAFLSTAFTGIVAYDVIKNLKENNSVSLGDALSHALRRPLLGVALMWAVFWILAMAWEAWIDSFGEGLGPAIAGFVPLGLYFGLLSVFLAVIPACVVDELGFLDSLQRSLELTSGRRIRIFFSWWGPAACLFHWLCWWSGVVFRPAFPAKPFCP
jgi:hypothetical protein